MVDRHHFDDEKLEWIPNIKRIEIRDEGKQQQPVNSNTPANTPKNEIRKPTIPTPDTSEPSPISRQPIK